MATLPEGKKDPLFSNRKQKANIYLIYRESKPNQVEGMPFTGGGGLFIVKHYLPIPH